MNDRYGSQFLIQARALINFVVCCVMFTLVAKIVCHAYLGGKKLQKTC